MSLWGSMKCVLLPFSTFDLVIPLQISLLPPHQESTISGYNLVNKEAKMHKGEAGFLGGG